METRIVAERWILDRNWKQAEREKTTITCVECEQKKTKKRQSTKQIIG